MLLPESSGFSGKNLLRAYKLSVRTDGVFALFPSYNSRNSSNQYMKAFRLVIEFRLSYELLRKLRENFDLGFLFWKPKTLHILATHLLSFRFVVLSPVDSPVNQLDRQLTAI